MLKATSKCPTAVYQPRAILRLQKARLIIKPACQANVIGSKTILKGRIALSEETQDETPKEHSSHIESTRQRLQQPWRDALYGCVTAYERVCITTRYVNLYTLFLQLSAFGSMIGNTHHPYPPGWSVERSIANNKHCESTS